MQHKGSKISACQYLSTYLTFKDSPAPLSLLHFVTFLSTSTLIWQTLQLIHLKGTKMSGTSIIKKNYSSCCISEVIKRAVIISLDSLDSFSHDLLSLDYCNSWYACLPRQCICSLECSQKGRGKRNIKK